MDVLLFLVFITAVAVIIGTQRGKRKKLEKELRETLMQQAQEREEARARGEESEPDTDDSSSAFRVSVSFGGGDYSDTPSPDEALAESEACWIPPGKAVEVAGYSIPDGMIYVGEKLRATQRWGTDAALIDPRKTVSREQIDRTGSSMGYWPSYSDIYPGSRAAYLEWLASGRRDPNAYVGYVFLFLYGIERRLFHDIKGIGAVKAETPVLLDEVRELIKVYGGSSGSFDSYAANMVDALTLSANVDDYERASPPSVRVGWEYPIQFKLAVGALVQAGKPLPPEWALAWVRCNPEARLRTPADRCAREFDTLYKVRYAEAFPAGLQIKPNKTRLKATYRPASPSLSEVEIPLPDLPDVTKLSAPLKQLMNLAETVQDELDQYSRQLGQGKEPDSIPALATLPSEAHPEALTGEAKLVIDAVMGGLESSAIVTLNSADLVALYPAKTAGKLTKKEATLLAQFLGQRGFGIEPDARYGGINLSSTERCVVYRLEGPDTEPGAGFRAATVLLHLGVAMAKADGEVSVDEQKRLEEHMEQALQLNEAERKRLAAHLQWLLADPPTLTGAKSRIQELEEKQRHSLGQFLISIAAADGHISPSEIKILSKIYPLLGLDPDTVYGDVHSLAVGDQGPVTVLRPDGKTKSFSIPQEPEKEGGKPEETIKLDANRIAAIREQSREAAAVLSSVFAQEEAEPEDESVDALNVDDDKDTSGLIAGLDARHSAFLRILAEQAQWRRDDFELLAQRHDLLPGGAIEAMNEASFEVCGEALLEGDDPIEINQYAKAEILA